MTKFKRTIDRSVEGSPRSGEESLSLDLLETMNSPLGRDLSWGLCRYPRDLEAEPPCPLYSKILSLYGDEESTLTSPERKKEFLAGRLAAHRALSKLGWEKHLIIQRGPLGEPVWPTEGLNGSITHDQGVAVAAVTSSKFAHGLGLDLQSQRKSLSESLTRRISQDDEMSWWNQSLLESSEAKALWIFSAKEAVLKAASFHYKNIGSPPLLSHARWSRWLDSSRDRAQFSVPNMPYPVEVTSLWLDNGKKVLSLATILRPGV